MTKSRSDRLDAFDAVNLLCLTLALAQPRNLLAFWNVLARDIAFCAQGTLALAKPRNLLAFWNGLARDVAFCAQGTGILFFPSFLLVLMGKRSVAASEE